MNLERILPSSADAEKATLGAMLTSSEACFAATSLLTADDFYYVANRVVFAEIVAMMQDGVPVDLVLLTQRLGDKSKLDEAGGAAAVSDLMFCCASPSMITEYVRVVAGKSMQRRVIEEAVRLTAAAFDSEEPATLATSAAATFTKLHDDHCAAFGIEKTCPFKSMQELEKDFIEFVTKEHPRTLSLHGWLPHLARKAGLTTLVPGEVILIVGDVGTGKSAFAQNLSRCIAPHPVGFFSMELPGTKIFRRFVQLDQRMLSDEVWQKYRGGEIVAWDTERLGNIWTCEESGLTTAGIRYRVQALTKKLGIPPALVVVDYMQLVHGMGKRYERTSDAAEDLKVMAKQEHTIVCILSQVQRPDDKNATADPGLHSGKDSGSLEASAGLLLAISRDPFGVGEKTRMRLKICKQSDGEAGQYQDCYYDGAHMRIEEMLDDVLPPKRPASPPTE